MLKYHQRNYDITKLKKNKEVKSVYFLLNLLVSNLSQFECRCTESQAANANCWPERSFDRNGILLSLQCDFSII